MDHALATIEPDTILDSAPEAPALKRPLQDFCLYNGGGWIPSDDNQLIFTRVFVTPRGEKFGMTREELLDAHRAITQAPDTTYPDVEHPTDKAKQKAGITIPMNNVHIRVRIESALMEEWRAAGNTTWIDNSWPATINHIVTKGFHHS